VVNVIVKHRTRFPRGREDFHPLCAAIFYQRDNQASCICLYLPRDEYFPGVGQKSSLMNSMPSSNSIYRFTWPTSVLVCEKVKVPSRSQQPISQLVMGWLVRGPDAVNFFSPADFDPCRIGLRCRCFLDAWSCFSRSWKLHRRGLHVSSTSSA